MGENEKGRDMSKINMEKLENSKVIKDSRLALFKELVMKTGPTQSVLDCFMQEIEELRQQLAATQQQVESLRASVYGHYELEAERDALLADNARLREVLSWYVSFNGVVTSGEAEEAEEALAATQAQSLARVRNQVREECIEVARLHGTNRTVEAIRAMKEPE